MNPLDDFEADSIDAQAAGWLVRNRYDSSRHNRKAFKQWNRTVYKITKVVLIALVILAFFLI